MVYKILANASVKEVGKSFSAVCAHSNQVGIDTVAKMEYPFLNIHIIVNVCGVAAC